MPRDEAWLEMLLRRWRVLSPDVRSLLQAYMNLPTGDRKNQRRLEKKLKIAAFQSESFVHEPTQYKTSR